MKWAFFLLLLSIGLVLEPGCYKDKVVPRPFQRPAYTPADSPGLTSPNKSIKSFIIKAADNPGLPGDVIGSIFYDTVRLIFDSSTNLSSLIPTITITGKSISPASLVAQNFDSAVTYTVTATDGSILYYHIGVWRQ